MSPISFEGVLTLPDFLRVNALPVAYHPLTQWQPTYYASLLIVGLGLALIRESASFEQLIAIVFVPTVLLLYDRRRHARVTQAWKGLGEKTVIPHKGVITDEAICLEQDGGRMEKAWRLFAFYQFDGDMIILYPNPRTFIALSRSFFSSMEAWERTCDIIERAVPDSPPSNWHNPLQTAQRLVGWLLLAVVILYMAFA